MRHTFAQRTLDPPADRHMEDAAVVRNNDLAFTRLRYGG